MLLLNNSFAGSLYYTKCALCLIVTIIFALRIILMDVKRGRGACDVSGDMYGRMKVEKC